MPHLVIVESPAKAKTINKFLGKDYVVKASVGHIRDLPQDRLAVDVENGFLPEYVVSEGKSKVVKELQDHAKTADLIYLAPDPDREGEAIAWHLQEILKKQVKDPKRFLRVTYNQITKDAINRAFQEPRQIDQNKVDAQQARRVLDRLVGYQVSPLVWRTVRGGSSAGRVQTVALRLIVEREKEIRGFTPEAYWVVGAKAAKQSGPRDPFQVNLVRLNGGKPEVKNRELADRIVAELPNRGLRVATITRKQVQRRAPPPFITSTLQQAASSQLGYSPSRTMGLAQKLYEGVDLGQGGVTGLITYMRTDSLSLASEAIGSIRSFVQREFGGDYLPEQAPVYKSRDSAQGAHEAIRPTDITRTPDDVRHVLDPNELKVYTLIWRRTVASQMSPARINQLMVDIDAPRNPGAPGAEDLEFLFRANASEVAFPGYMKVLGVEEKKDDETTLPPLAEGEALDVVEWLCDQKQTQPPNRYSEAALIKALEENGVGRPSTYASIVSTLYARKYAENEKRSIRPTEVGIKVCDYLVTHLNNLFDVGFTAQMEEKLDLVEKGEVNWQGMLAEFYQSLGGWIVNAKGPPATEENLRPLLNELASVRTWAPPSGPGKRKYSDEKFVQDIHKALAEGKKPVSQRQLENLRKIVIRYREQIPGLDDARLAGLGLAELLVSEAAKNQPPEPVTVEKLDALRLVSAWAEPRTVGKKTYDDRAFVQSLREQVEAGRRLSPPQEGVLDRILGKYTTQIPEFSALAQKWGMIEVGEDKESGPLLELMASVKEFAPAVQRGKRVWSDQEFFTSLSTQFQTKKSLSPKQRFALKKMAARYAAQIPDYEEKREPMNLLAPKSPGGGGAKGRGKGRGKKGKEFIDEDALDSEAGVA